jgi:hypothetical protein
MLFIINRGTRLILTMGKNGLEKNERSFAFFEQTDLDLELESRKFISNLMLKKIRRSATLCGKFHYQGDAKCIQYESSIAEKVGGSDFSALDNAKYVKTVRIGHL